MYATSSNFRVLPSIALTARSKKWVLRRDLASERLGLKNSKHFGARGRYFRFRLRSNVQLACQTGSSKTELHQLECQLIISRIEGNSGLASLLKNACMVLGSTNASSEAMLNQTCDKISAGLISR